MARTVADLELALGVLAGPEGEESAAYRLALPPPRATALKDFRVLVLNAHPLAQAAADVRGPIEALADRLGAMGAKVSRSTPLLPDLARLQATYLVMLQTTMGRRPDATAPIDAFAWFDGLDRIVAARLAWAELFRSFDVVLAPPFGVPAFEHNSEMPFAERTLTIDGQTTPYAAQIAWPGIAAFPGLPATCAPLARTSGGLPTGVQIIGPRFEDMTTLAFAGLIEREIGPL
jgi:amidase